MFLKTLSGFPRAWGNRGILGFGSAPDLQSYILQVERVRGNFPILTKAMNYRLKYVQNANAKN